MTLLGVFGVGGCGRGILPLVRDDMGAGSDVVFVDDHRAGDTVNGARVLSLAAFAEEGGRSVCVAIANPAARRAVADRCVSMGFDFFSANANDCRMMDAVDIGLGALISPRTVITSNVRIGQHFHLNLYSYVEHDCVIGDYVTFAPSVRCNGNVTIGDGAYIGSNAVLRQGVSIGRGAAVGMGAVVVRDVPEGETWVGNPARPIVRPVR